MAPLSSREAYRAYLVVEVLRATGEREFPLQLASTLLWIGAHNGCLQQDLVKATSMSPSSVSRNVSWLSSTHRLGKPGLGLVRREQDQLDYKRWRLWLTPKGEQLISLIEQHLLDPL
jgi:DNA-binding MarR family transcriptional regulator